MKYAAEVADNRATEMFRVELLRGNEVAYILLRRSKPENHFKLLVNSWIKREK